MASGTTHRWCTGPSARVIGEGRWSLPLTHPPPKRLLLALVPAGVASIAGALGLVTMVGRALATFPPDWYQQWPAFTALALMFVMATIAVGPLIWWTGLVLRRPWVGKVTWGLSLLHLGVAVLLYRGLSLATVVAFATSASWLTFRDRAVVAWLAGPR